MRATSRCGESGRIRTGSSSPPRSVGRVERSPPRATNGLASDLEAEASPLELASRELDPRAAEIAEALLEAAPQTIALDRIGAEEIGSRVVLMDRVDAALSDGRVENRKARCGR